MQPELEKLMVRYIAGERDAALIKHITDAVADDVELRDEIREELALNRILREYGRMPLDPAPVLSAIAAHRHNQRLEKRVMARISGVQQARRRASRQRRAWGSFATAALVMIAIFGGITLALLPTTVKQPAQTPVQESLSLASVHYIRAVRWSTDQTQSPTDGARVKSGSLSLASGVVELRFDNSAALVLEGPLRMDLQSRMKVLLHRGRLTTNIPPTAKGFTVVTERLQIVDQGTEVGIDLAADGQAQVHVIAGAAEIRINGFVGAAPATPTPEHLGAGEARKFTPTTGTLAKIEFDAERFVRTGLASSLAIDVADLIAGGDGRGTGTMAGLNPSTGQFQSDISSYLDGPNTYHRASGSAFIDGAFLLRTGPIPTVVNSAGSQYAFNNTSSLSYDLIRRGGILLLPGVEGVTKPTPSPTVIAGTDFASFGHQLIGMHASCGFTIDLHAIAMAYERKPTRFTSILVNAYLAPKAAVAKSGNLVILIDGRVVQNALAPLSTQAPVKLDIPLSSIDRFLTIVSTDGGQDSSAQWTTLGDPKLMLASPP